jgi:hypothetical protein
MRIPFGFFGNLINSIIANFKNTVFANNGIFEAENYLYNILNSLMAYYNSFVVFITANAYEQNFLFAIKPTPITENYYLQTTASVFTSCCTTTKTFDVTANEFTITAEIEPYQGNEGVLEICGGNIGANWTFTYNSSGQFQLQLPGVTGTIVSTVTKTPIRIRQWVRVSKIASLTYNFFFSLDGINWTQVGGNAVMLAGGGPVIQNATANSTNINVGRGSGGSGCFIGKIYSCNFYTSGDPFAILPPLEIGMLSSLEEPGGSGPAAGTGLFANFKADEAPIGRYSTWASVLTGEVWSINQGNGNPQISNQGVALYTGGGSRFRINSAGLLENVKKNLVVGSEFEVGWTANGNNVSIFLADKSFVNYGINNGMKVRIEAPVAGIDSGIGGSSGSQSVTLTAGVQYAISFLFKVTGSTTKCGYYSSVASQISGVFDLIANTRTTAYSDNVTKNSFLIENLGNNVYRCTDVFTCNVSSNFTFLRLGFAVGSQTAGMEGAFGGLQVEVGNARTSYQYTTTDAIYPRLDYTYGAPAILSEPAATNLIQNSMLLNSGGIPSGWSNNISTGTGGSASIVASGLSGIFDSKSTINKYTFNVSGTVGTINALINRSVTVVSGSSYVISVRIESYSGNIRYNDIIYTIAQSSFAYFINGVSVGLGNGLINQTGLLECRITTNATTANIIYGLGMYGSINGGAGGTASIVLSAPQFELGTIATSFISTIVGATSTRVADSFNYINNSIINQTQGTLYFEFYYSGQSIGAFRPILGISDVNGIGGFDYIAVYSNSVGTGLQLFLRSGNINRVTSSYTTFNTGWNKIAVVFSPTSVTPYFNGVNLGSTTPNNSPNSWAVTLDRIQIGNLYPILIKNIAYMPSATALTNSQLLALTT